MPPWWLLLVARSVADSTWSRGAREVAWEVAQRLAEHDACVSARPIASDDRDLLTCCAALTTISTCWPKQSNRSERISRCCLLLETSLVQQPAALIEEKSFVTAVNLTLWLMKHFPKNFLQLLPVIQEAMVKQKELFYQRAYSGFDWSALAKHYFEADADHPQQVLTSGNFGLLAAWTNAHLGLNNTATDRASLICNISSEVESLSPEKLEIFQHFSEHPSFDFFSTSPLNPVKVDARAENQAFQRYPQLLEALSQMTEPKESNIYGHLLRSYGLSNEVSLPFRTGTMLLCIIYSLGHGGAWANATSDLEIFEVGGGHGLLASMAARLWQTRAMVRRRLGFRAWNIIDLRHVSALQAWFLSKTLPTKVHLERFCANGFRSRLIGTVSSNLETWQMPSSSKPVVRLVDTAVKDIWLFSHHETEQVQKTRLVRVMVAMLSWTECDMEQFLWYFNHILPLCQYLVLGYMDSFPYEDSRIKIALIQKFMSPIETFSLGEVEKMRITLFRRNEIKKMLRLPIAEFIGGVGPTCSWHCSRARTPS